ncbi:MAG: hypothetical protein ACRETM_07790, partial [Stenotrophobium sp.]
MRRIFHETGRRAGLAMACALLMFVSGQSQGQGLLPYGITPAADADDYASYLFIKNGDCSQGKTSVNDLPPNFDCTNFKFTDYREPVGLTASYDPLVANNPQEFYGVEGPAANRAWEVSTGRPDVVNAIMDSGIEWQHAQPQLVNKIYLNRGELPLPVCANGQT